MNRRTSWVTMLTATSLLSACGGGKGNPPTPPTPAPSYTIGGAITGLTSSGLVLQVNGGNNISPSSGASSFTSSNSLTTGTAYAVTVLTQPALQTCTVSAGTGSVASANVTNVAVACVVNTFTVSATVSGLNGTGLVLQLNGGAGLSVTSSGAVTFANRVNAATAYAVTVQTQPSTPVQQCTVTNGSGAGISANVTNVTVACANVTTISGVAAVGAPLVGTVTVKDSANNIRGPLVIGSNGSYTVDVNGMTPPFVFRAEGTANGRTYIVHSAAVTADVGGNINITQLTDLVVDNIAGQVATAYFNNGNFASLTPTALNAELAILKQRLLPVLTALGVEASIDLLRSRFTPTVSALDDALDILRVTVDTNANVATITNIVTQQTIQDTITVPAASESNPPVLDNTGNLVNAMTDSDAVRAALNSFAAKFATGLPPVGDLELGMTTTYLDNDQDRATAAAELAANPILIGGSFTDVNIKNIDYTDPTQITANVDFSMKDRNGIEFQRATNFRIRKGSDNVWRLHGNQRVMIAHAIVHPFRSLTTGCRGTGWEFHIIDRNAANNGAVINHIMVFGPGLPGGGLRYDPPTLGGMWNNTTQGGQGHTLANSCWSSQTLNDTAIAAIPDDAGYVFIPFTSADNSVRHNFPSGAIPTGSLTGAYWDIEEKRPPTLAELIVSTLFPTITSPDSTALAAYTSGNLAIVATGVNPKAYVDLILERHTANGNDEQVDGWQPPTSAGTISTSLSLPPLVPGDTITLRSVRVASDDIYRRHFMTGY